MSGDQTNSRQRPGAPAGVGRLGRAALAAAAAGHYVFPLQPRSKMPAVRDWERAATRDPGQIAAWFGARPYNPAIACGPSGLVVVDLDDGHGDAAPPPWTGARHGREVWDRLAEQAGGVVPRTYMVATPTGGMHRYYRAPEAVELRNSAAMVGWRVDIRAHGGYVVAADAVRDLGERRGDRAGYYRVVERAPIAPLPGWLLDALTPPTVAAPTVAAVGAAVVGARLGDDRARAYVATIVEREAAAVAAAPRGTRHTTLLAAARTLGRLVGGGELGEAQARAALTAAAAGYLGYDYTTAQVERDISDGLGYGARLPRRVNLSAQRDLVEPADDQPGSTR